jgi:hypothetical protein
VYGRALVAAALLCAQSIVAQAQLPGDGNCDGALDASDLDAIVDALYVATDCPGADANGDGAVSAADLEAVVLLLAVPTATPTVTISSTATATATQTTTATATPTATATATPTFELCPGAAELQINVDNQTTATPISFTVSGRLVTSTCRNQSGLDETYTVASDSSPQSVTQLAPGVWVHSFTLDSPHTGQLQHRPTVLLANAGANQVRFTAFASVTTVLNPSDGLGRGTFRDALLATAAALKPHLIQFDEVLFPSGVETVTILGSALPALSSSGVTIDGIDATGKAGNRVLDANGRPNSVLGISGASNTVVGMRLRNSGQNNRDVLSISGTAARLNVIDHCIIEQSATGDGIGIDSGAGSDFLATANIVRDTEVSGASDKGIKVTTNAYARIEHNWVHDNTNGGIQTTLSGHVAARDNLVERNTGNAQARNGLSVNGTAPDTPLIASELVSDANIARFNGGNGVSLRGLSIATLSNDYLAANAQDGLRVAAEGGAGTLVVKGTAFACNAVNGAVVESGSQADFGGGPLGSSGNNAFTQNNLPGGFENLFNQTAATLYAINNQWEHCGLTTVCDQAAIAAYDVSDHGRFSAFLPAQAHRSHLAPAITEVRPSKGVAGDLIRIFGSGFNVIDGHAADAACPDLVARNRCLPLRGNCVRFGALSAPIEALTPTMIVVRLPVSCIQPLQLTVTTQDGGISAPLQFCTNVAP